MTLAVADGPIDQLALAAASFLALLIVAVLTELTRRRTARIDETVGETESDRTSGEEVTIAHHVASTDQNVAAMADQVHILVDLMRTSDALMTTRLDHIDTVLDARGQILSEIKDSLISQGERIGSLDRRLTVVETRLELSPGGAP